MKVFFLLLAIIYSSTAKRIRSRNIKRIESIEWLYKNINYPNMHNCKNYHVLEGENALEPDVHICMDNILPPCNVISIGIAYNFLFDDYMLSQGCRVWSYDPSMRPGNYKRHENHEFFHVGIGHFDGIYRGKSTLYGGGINYEVKTLSTIMRDMGIDKVDMIRIDTEGAEWDVLPSWNYSSIDQLLVEIHMYDTLENHATILNNIPMNIFWSTRNRWNSRTIYKDMTQVYELGFIKR